jgi:hypothetical protein
VRSAVEQQQRLVKVWSPAIQKIGGREPVAASTAERSFPSKLGQERSGRRDTVCCPYELMWLNDSMQNIAFSEPARVRSMEDQVWFMAKYVISVGTQDVSIDVA